jgi:hypothetical protein
VSGVCFDGRAAQCLAAFPPTTHLVIRSSGKRLARRVPPVFPNHGLRVAGGALPAPCNSQIPPMRLRLAAQALCLDSPGRSLVNPGKAGDPCQPRNAIRRGKAPMSRRSHFSISVVKSMKRKARRQARGKPIPRHRDVHQSIKFSAPCRLFHHCPEFLFRHQMSPVNPKACPRRSAIVILTMLSVIA